MSFSTVPILLAGILLLVAFSVRRNRVHKHIDDKEARSLYLLVHSLLVWGLGSSALACSTSAKVGIERGLS